MRTIAGLLLQIVPAIAVAGQVYAQPSHLMPAQRALLDAVFAAKAATLAQTNQTLAAGDARALPRVELASDGTFALPAFSGSRLDQAHLARDDRLIDGQGLAVWRSSEVSFPAQNGAVDTLRVSVGGLARGRGGVVFARPDSLLAPDAETFDVSFTRGWPSAFSLGDGRYALDISPHAGLAFGDSGGSAEAGALVRFGRRLATRVGQRLGITANASPAESGFFLFAAASGRAVGVSVAPGPAGLRSGWAGEATTGLVSDAQAGVGWRRGDMQASLGYVHRNVRNETAMAGPVNYHDSMVALSFSITPH